MEEAIPLTDGSRRIASIDILRGMVIVIMVLDHVRDFMHVDATTFDPLDPTRTTATLYATRWISSFCAPTFVFLAGASAWLQRARGKSRGELSRFLLSRGLWLMLLEVTVLSVAWSFSIPFLPSLQVIWAIGFGMVGLSALLWLPRIAVLVIGILIIAGHNLFDGIIVTGPLADLWMALHAGGLGLRHGVPYAWFFYPVLPWLGVLLLGYGIGPVFLAPPKTRDRTLAALGIMMLITFLLLRVLNIYGDPHPWISQRSFGRTVMDILRVEKYPPSLSFVCATLGPVLLLVPLIERWRGAGARFFGVFGAVPLFVYVVHVYAVHALSVALRMIDGQSIAAQFDQIRVFAMTPHVLDGSGFSLAAIYAIWIALVAALYPLCRWFRGVKRRRKDVWLSYL